MEIADFVIIGGGIVGLTIAKKLLQQGHSNIHIIEKEPTLAVHGSGRNSGVLHAGIYYPEETLKARFCLDGNRRMQAYCRQNNLSLRCSGKVVVARNEEELPRLKELYRRAEANGAKVSLIDEKNLAQLEPNAKTTQLALYSQDTAVVDPAEIIHCLAEELLGSNKVKIHMGCAFIKPLDKSTLLTSQGKISYGYLVNAAGVYADKIAHAFDLGKQFVFLPFKGLYKKLSSEYSDQVNGNIYPVPNLNNPFLGVHLTKNIVGDVYLGPTAIPAWGRENYGFVQGVSREVLKILYRQFVLFCTNSQFRQVALSEPKKYNQSVFFNDAKKLVKRLEQSWLVPTSKVGIRAQLINWKEKTMVMDFYTEQTENSLHVLNAISPAFTSALSFADYLVTEKMGI